ncbi:MAG: hypothetical protein ABI581_06160 [Sediminibacterium sp.]
MKKIITLLILLVPYLSQAQKKPSIKRYNMKMGISLLGGIQNSKGLNTAPVFGAEISIACPLVHSQKNYIRQYIRFTQQGDETYKTTSVELNPQISIFQGAHFNLGIGPNTGVIFATKDGEQRTRFSYGLGASTVYSIKKISFGIGMCFAATNKVSFTDTDNKSSEVSHLNNLKTFLKVGYNF